MAERTFLPSELSRCNGQSGAPAYIAFQGRVYDVSLSYHWRGGRHWVTHFAGRDLTGEIRLAPHGPEMLLRFPVVGLLEDG